MTKARDWFGWNEEATVVVAVAAVAALKPATPLRLRAAPVTSSMPGRQAGGAVLSGRTAFLSLATVL